MKLLQYTARYFGWFILLALPLTTGILFLTTRFIINQEQNELLEDNGMALTRQWKANGLPTDRVLLLANDLIEVTESPLVSEKIFLDTTFWNADENEYEPARKYVFSTRIGQKDYLVSITHSVLDQEELLFTVLVSVALLIAVLLIGVWWFSRFAARRLWHPFYASLFEIAHFKFSDKSSLALPETTVEEFTALNRAVNTMTLRIVDDYIALRDFTGNAAHELQNPLAIIQNKAELLLQNDQLDPKTLGDIADIHRSVIRLARLNKALLFLHRIENEQFSNAAAIDLKRILIDKIAQWQERIDAKNIAITTDLQSVIKTMNPELVDALIGNLLVNAVKYNYPKNGWIHIGLSSEQLVFQNSGDPLNSSSESMFQRFKKNDPAQHNSPGLGLAIVKEICQLYGCGVVYTVENEVHKIVIQFGSI
jgi:signal transduction histidine kinase